MDAATGGLSDALAISMALTWRLFGDDAQPKVALRATTCQNDLSSITICMQALLLTLALPCLVMKYICLQLEGLVHTSGDMAIQASIQATRKGENVYSYYCPFFGLEAQLITAVYSSMSNPIIENANPNT